MTNYEMILQINDKARENIKKIKTNDKMDKINECLSFTEDLNQWLSYCGEFKDFVLVNEAQDEFNNYRLWKRGKYDMSWTQIVDQQKGIFGKEYINSYAKDIDGNRSIELLTIAKNIYRECSEYVHGNYGKLMLLTENMEYNEENVDRYIEVFESVKYLISVSLLIRFRELFDKEEILVKLESVLMDNLGMLPEVQELYNRER